MNILLLYMPLFIPVNFAAALSSNRAGQLTPDQTSSIHLVCRRRGQTATLLFLCWGFLAVLSSISLALPADPEFNNAGFIGVIGLLAIVSWAAVIWSIRIMQVVRRARAVVDTIRIQSTVGRPNKYNYGVPLRTPGATHVISLRQGWLSLDGHKYGVLPGELYGQISDQRPGRLYFVELKVPGFHDRLVVNYETAL